MLNSVTRTSAVGKKVLYVEKAGWEFHENSIWRYFMKTSYWSVYINLKKKKKILSMPPIYNLYCTTCNHLLSATKNCTLQNSNDIWKYRVLISSCSKVNHHQNAASTHGSLPSLWKQSAWRPALFTLNCKHFLRQDEKTTNLKSIKYRN